MVFPGKTWWLEILDRRPASVLPYFVQKHPSQNLEFGALLDHPTPLLDIFVSSFSESSWAYRLPPLQTKPPVSLTEFASSLGLGSTSARLLTDFQAPENFQSAFSEGIDQKWRTEERAIAQSLAVIQNRADQIWDTSIFTQDPSAVERDFREHGIFLEKTVPFRILLFGPLEKSRFPASLLGRPMQPKFSVQRQEPSASLDTASSDSQGIFLYITQGLSALYGQEFWCGFAHPHPTIPWFFLRLASFDKAQAPWLKDFQLLATDQSLSLGEPRDWWAAYLSVPLFGHLKYLYEKAAKQCPSLQDSKALGILFLSKADLLFIAENRMENFFAFLGEKQISWHNDLKRAWE